MSLTKELQIRLLAERGISKDEAEKMVNSEDEAKPELQEGRFYTPEDIGKIEGNKKTEGFIFGADKLWDAIVKNKKLNLSDTIVRKGDGLADIEESVRILTEAYDQIVKSSYTGKVDDQVKDLEEKIRVQKEKYEQLLENHKNDNLRLSNDLLTINSNNEIYSYIPENVNSPKLGIAAHIRTKIDPYQENGKWFAKDKSGNIIKNDMHDPLPLKDYTLNFLDNEGYIQKEETDMGGSQFKDGKVIFKDYQAFENYLKINNIELMSDDGVKLFNEAKKNGMEIPEGV